MRGALRGARLATPTLLPILLICGLIGFLRYLMEVLFGVRLVLVWYTWKLDVALCMVAGVMHLATFGPMLLDLVGRCCRVRVPPAALLRACYYLTGLNLLVPLLDDLGNMRLGWPYEFHLVRPPLQSHFFTTTLLMSTGIIVGWVAAAVILYAWYRRTQGIDAPRTILVLFISYQGIFWPVYHFYPAMNFVYYQAVGRPYREGEDFGGYVLYFLLCSLIGAAYFRGRHQIAWWPGAHRQAAERTAPVSS